LIDSSMTSALMMLLLWSGFLTTPTMLAANAHDASMLRAR
jgi:hypothetical protein